MKRISYLATAAKGTEPLLVEELEELGAENVAKERGLVRFSGDVELGWKACLWLRTAMRVLRPIREVPAHDADSLYEGIKKVRWEEHLSQQQTFAVEANVKDNPNLTHSHFVALKVKDAIVDQLRDQLGARPSINPKDPDVSVIAHIVGNRCYLSLDLSGEALFKRGYRVRGGAAPLKETLAAALVLSTNWGGRRPFADPMCGSGTIAIEAALIALNRAPGRHRQFGFQRWPSWGQSQVKRWREILADADEQAIARPPRSIIASDAADEAVSAAQANAQAAKVFEAIEFSRRDVRAFPGTRPPGILLMNPPYGERIGGRGEDVGTLYAAMGKRFRELKGHDVWVFSANDPKAIEAFGMPAVESIELWNGPLDCRLLHFAIT